MRRKNRQDYGDKTRLNCWSIITRAKFFSPPPRSSLSIHERHGAVRTLSPLLTIFVPISRRYEWQNRKYCCIYKRLERQKAEFSCTQSQLGMLKSASMLKMHIISSSLHKYHTLRTDASIHNTRHAFNVMTCLCASAVISMKKGEMLAKIKHFSLIESDGTLRLDAFVHHLHPAIPRVLSVWLPEKAPIQLWTYSPGTQPS